MKTFISMVRFLPRVLPPSKAGLPIAHCDLVLLHPSQLLLHHSLACLHFPHPSLLSHFSDSRRSENAPLVTSHSLRLLTLVILFLPLLIFTAIAGLGLDQLTNQLFVRRSFESTTGPFPPQTTQQPSYPDCQSRKTANRCVK
jgi:hypothetical protein